MRILITGAQGMLGSRLVEEAEARHHRVAPYDRPRFELARLEDAAALVLAEHPDWVIHAAAMTDVDGCESQAELAMALNGEASGAIARAAARLGARCLYISTDYVFDGRKATPYLEQDPTGPASAYGRSKLLGEEEVLKADGTVMRLSWSFGPDGNNFVKTIAGKLLSGEALRVVDDQLGSPTYTRDAAVAILDVVDRSGAGIYHCSNRGETSWFGFARAIARGLGLDETRVAPCTSAQFPRLAPRPANSRLDGRRLEALRRQPMPAWEDALDRYLEEEGWSAN